MQSLAQKQEYLSKQILDQGYDPEQFQDFMFNNSNKQLDLNLWTIAEIKNIVNKFKNKNKKVEEHGSGAGELEMHESANNQNKKQEENSKQQGEKSHDNHQVQHSEMGQSMISNSVNSSLYKYFVFKKKANIPEFYKRVHVQAKQFEVRIRNYYKTAPNNIFKFSYIQYQIQCPVFGWKVKRRFNDFVWLQSYFKKIYEGLPIPPIPQKTSFRSFDEKHIEYRMMMFERFLTTLVQMPQPCSDQLLEIFLKQNEETFNKLKKKFTQKLENRQGSNQIQSVFGDQLVLMDQHGISSPTINFYRQYTTKLLNLSSNLNIMIEGLQKTSQQSFQISSCFQQIQSHINSFGGFSVVSIFQQYTNSLGMYLEKTSQFIKSSIYSIWNYEAIYSQNLATSLAKIQKQRTYMSQKYKNAMVKVSDQGTNAFINNNEPNKTIKEFQMVKQQYRIKLSHIVREMRRYQTNQMVFISKQWSLSLKMFINSISEWMISCTDALTKSISLNQGKKLMEVEYVNPMKKMKQKEKQKQQSKQKIDI